MGNMPCGPFVDESLLVALAAICTATIVSDFFFRRVFNWLIVAGLAIKAGVLVFLACSPSIVSTAWSDSLLGLVLGLVFLVPLYAFRAMGAGDVKFFALLGFWLGVANLLPVWILGSVLAGVHVLATVIYGQRIGFFLRWLPVPALLAQGWEKVRRAVLKVRGSRQGVPYAAYMGLGVLLMVSVS